MTVWLQLLILAVLGIIGLGLLDVYHEQLAHTWLGFTIPFWHHLFALVSGASTAGILFELFARDHFVRKLKQDFLSDEDLVSLFADTKRQRWVRKLLAGQIAGDPTGSLSSTIYSDVVEPFMEKRKFRSRMHYSIALSDSPLSGWSHGRIELPHADYVRMTVELAMVQHLPAPSKRDAHPRRYNVSVVFGAAPEDLQAAFDDEQCIFREHLMLLDNARSQDLWEKFAADSAADPSQLAALGLSVSIFVNGASVSLSNISRESGRLQFWFTYPGPGPIDVAVHLSAPYPRRMKYFEVVFGEPAASPHVTFEPMPGVSPAQVAVIDFLQGPRRAGPECHRDATRVDVTFPPLPDVDVPRWILPRSGLFFLWE